MNKNICTGTGLIALDVILNGKPETPPKLQTGGSCGNVLSVLSFFGWSSFPIARFANNSATKEIKEDFKIWGIKDELISIEDDGSTPIIIHRILKDKDGNPKHKFEFKDPETNKWLPSYKPVLNRDVNVIMQKLPSTKVFYFDRINRGSIELAKANKSKGAIIFFEPSSIGNKESLFQECLKVADIIKFSHERISNYAELFEKPQVSLEIETRGVEGIRYRFKSDLWQTINAYKISNVVDTAGAGDWCSAGIIDMICKDGIDAFNYSTSEYIKSALQYGQLLGALNCCFDGARGLMYSISKPDFNKVIKKAQESDVFDLRDIVFKKETLMPVRSPLKISTLYL